MHGRILLAKDLYSFFVIILFCDIMVIMEVPKSKYKIIKKAIGKRVGSTKNVTTYTSTINNPQNKRLIKAKKGVVLRYV